MEGMKAWGHVMVRDRTEDSSTRYLEEVRYHHPGSTRTGGVQAEVHVLEAPSGLCGRQIKRTFRST